MIRDGQGVISGCVVDTIAQEYGVRSLRLFADDRHFLLWRLACADLPDANLLGQVAQALGGHAWDRAGKIWYKAMFDLKPSSSFQEFAQTTYDVACALYPEATAEREAVQKAWETVGITVKVKKL